MKCFKFLFDAVTTDLTDQTIIKNPIGVQKVTKKVPRWSYKLTDEFEEEEQEEENEEETTEDPEIRSRKAKRVVIFNDNSENSDTDTSTSTSDNSNQAEEVALIRYSQQPDFRRDLIKGSMRAQRRKTTICEMFQGNGLRISSNQNEEYIELKNRNQEEKEQRGQDSFGSDPENQKNLGSDARNPKKDLEKDSAETESDIKNKKRKKKKQSKSKKEAELDLLLKKYFLFQLRWNETLNEKIINNVKVYCLLLRLINPNEIAISSIERGEICLDVMLIDKELTVRELITKGIFIIEPVRLSLKRDGQFLMYQTLSISLAHKSKHKTNPRFRKGKYVDEINPNFDGSIAQDRKTLGNRDENHYDLLFLPENILSPVRRRELRILMDFNCGNGNVVDRNTVLCNRNNIKKIVCNFLDENKYLDIDTNKCIQLKLFLWPNYRLEDLACMNRYWFDTNNSSRFGMLRIHMYPRYRII
ncbi:hypothetical protein H6P81_021536 [Aristolochia fimbriata]|uniref:Ycf1 n=1 Tax=Aristolochia fimbriata TaxID=158543 RepID=A0AAV7DSK2_ARIFI|nr:hypothetical protein H6P81_021536 [Aristolochia fimbriata]